MRFHLAIRGEIEFHIFQIVSDLISIKNRNMKGDSFDFKENCFTFNAWDVVKT